MKRLLFCALCALMSLSSFAQWVTYEEEGKDPGTGMFFQLNRQGLEYNYEGGGDDVCVLKNYKKDGNVETFDVYDPDGEKLLGKVKIENDDASCSTGRYTMTGATSKWGPKNCSFRFKGDSDDMSASGGNVIPSKDDAIKESAKKAVDKVKGLFKKKK